MTKNELQVIALRLFNQGCLNSEDVRYSADMRDATNKEYSQCMDYIDELFRVGKNEYIKRYRL